MEGTKWAILIGVDYYQDGKERTDIKFRSLKGSVEDIRQIEELLRTRFDFNDPYIIRLTATTPDSGQGGPKELPPHRPTYENIIQAFERVIREANPHDIVYIHYSGHGARVDTIFPDIKEKRLDEALVPTDISCQGRYVRDVEIAYLINKLVDKKLIVTLVLDCCHSGGANRSGGPGCGPSGGTIRGIDRVGKNIPERDFSLLSPQKELIAVWKEPEPKNQRAATVENHWLLESRGYAFLAACRTNEFAMEDVFDKKTQGLLTHTMINIIKASTASLTYYGLYNLVRAKVLEHNSQQTVVLGGEADRIFLSSDCRKLHSMVPIKRVTKEGGKLHIHLDVGSTHGIPDDASIDVWPPSYSGSDYEPSEKSAVFRTVKIEGLTLDAELEKWGAKGEHQIQPGFLAQPHTFSKKRVYLDPINNSGMGQAKPPLWRHGEKETLIPPQDLAKVKRILETHNIPISDDPANASFQVHVEDGNYKTLCNTKKLPNRIALPPLPIDDESAAEKLARCIKHATKYYDILELSNPEIGSPGQWVSASLSMKKGLPPVPMARLFNHQPDNTLESKSCEVEAADVVTVLVTNISSTEKHITVLDLDDSGCVMQIFPCAPGGTQQLLAPNETLSLPLVVDSTEENVAPGQIIDTIKIIATKEPTNFRWLELPSLDKIKSGTSNRGDDINKKHENAFELLQQVTRETAPKARSVSVRNSDTAWWDTAQVTLRLSMGKPEWDLERNQEEAAPRVAPLETQLSMPQDSDTGTEDDGSSQKSFISTETESSLTGEESDSSAEGSLSKPKNMSSYAEENLSIYKANAGLKTCAVMKGSPVYVQIEQQRNNDCSGERAPVIISY
ncbi:hypothetical protein TWF970_004862 [Orbilia oligospora]|uniref:Peptidase C14 caspase domain-containing protein n=1 Tax=Orbilia oligospora TaxID=2813651 RepID=A0A7C8RCV9_ORBOL|nr:hypothetical protein TWF970_004862 [Orbilia oligospora]